MKIPVEHALRFSVAAPLATSFALVADVPRSVSHFPGVDQLLAQGDGVYRWEMEPLGAMGISHQVVYANKYVADDAAKSVTWTPVRGVGNGVMQGRWLLTADGGGTAIDFHTEGELDVPVPALLRAAAAPFIRGLFQKQVQGYLDNIKRTLSS